ncbi:SPOR domain-containing protein [Halomonas organivorans]|uniref:DedD protein n=1 Tax=Halomonas organivorans TaxID=257772 RepID=A0A7W5G503_9GAMM|nr:SPOR domain-containing protein [Halomonas organivorans]MBB3140555.1 DedD protein [Halomonas organivorans]
MKYGMRERVSGVLILIALAVIFVPLLFDDPAPRDNRPEPSLTIEQPVEVAHREPAAPQPPDGLSDSARVSDSPNDATVSETAGRVDEEEATATGDAVTESAPAEDDAVTAAPSTEPASEPERSTDPIADLARAADERMASTAERTQEAVSGGEWAVQVGSFGEPGNAERLEARLKEQGFPAYRRPRNNNLTSVYVGPYASSEVAEEAMAELKAGLNLQGLLVETE